MRKMLFGLLAALVFFAVPPAKAQDFPGCTQPLDCYYFVQDSSPGTQVWATLRGQFVALADATYVAWKAAPYNVTQSIDTFAHMMQSVSAIAATVPRPGFSTLDSAASIPTPTPLVVFDNTGNPADTLLLPPASTTLGIPVGASITIYTTGGNDVNIKVQDNTTVVAHMGPFAAATFYLTDNTTKNGTWAVFSQNVVAGQNAPSVMAFNSSFPTFMVAGGSNLQPSIFAGNFANNANGGQLVAAHSRATAPGTFSALNTSDVIGSTQYAGDDGSAFQIAAQVQAVVDGTVGAGIVPSRLVFSTTTSSGVLTQAAQFDSAQHLSLGGAATQAMAGGLLPSLQQNGVTAATASFYNVRWQANANGAATVIAHSRGASIGTHAALTLNDGIGTLQWQGDDGTNFQASAQIVAAVDNTVSAGVVPSRMAFSTATSGGVLTEVMRLTSTGGMAVGTTSDPGLGLIYINSASFLMRTKTSWTNGAGASVGTITNAPAVGNPTKWIPVDDNGTTRYIPAW